MLICVTVAGWIKLNGVWLLGASQEWLRYRLGINSVSIFHLITFTKLTMSVCFVFFTDLYVISFLVNLCSPSWTCCLITTHVGHRTWIIFRPPSHCSHLACTPGKAGRGEHGRTTTQLSGAKSRELRKVYPGLSESVRNQWTVLVQLTTYIYL